MYFENKNPVIFLVSGKSNVGKSTFSQYLKQLCIEDNKKVIIIPITSYLKEITKNVTGWDMSEDTKPRTFLQEIGNFIRNDLDMKDILVKRMKEDICVYSHFYDVIIVPDIRLKNELEDLKTAFNNVITINIKRDNISVLTIKEKEDITEIDLNDYDNYDYKIINNDSLKFNEEINKLYKEVCNVRNN